MSEHDELADRREQEANYLEAAAERNEDLAEEARDALDEAQQDEFTPAALGPDDPGGRDEDETPPPEEDDDPARARA